MANLRKDNRRKEVQKLRKEGLTIYAISQKLNIQPGLVSYYIDGKENKNN